jgi:hypothetical protein
MSANQSLVDLLRIHRRHSKFLKIDHSSVFIDPAAELGEGFYYASVYDEAIDANLYETDHGYVLIENSYIASFAYNLFFCWLYCKDKNASVEELHDLLAHNLKKLCAEQLYRRDNTVSSRALLLETLLYEERKMLAVFATKQTNPGLAELAWTAGSGVMLFLLTQHEFGHYNRKTKRTVWDAYLQSGPELIGDVIWRVEHEYSSEFQIEFKCDLFAVYSCLRQYENLKGATFALRAIAFAYAAYAAMYSVAATAEQTSRLWEQEGDEEVVFQDISKYPTVEVPIQLAIDRQFLNRALLIVEVCEKIAADRGLLLYGDEAPLVLTPNIVETLMTLVPRVFECDDDHTRQMSRLVARAFHSHEQGIEYLYLRSKTFRTNRDEPLTV